MLRDKKHIHFVGVGGIGMSGLALVLSRLGHTVSGSDLERTALTEKIASGGARIYNGHRASHLGTGTELVVYSSSIRRENPEIAEASRRGIPFAHRADILAELLNARDGIAVTGTHGKTTTTSLIAVMLERCGFDPTAIVGGELKELGGNAKLGTGRYLVAEADESDGSFLKFRPLYAVITNIEMEHVDYYTTLDEAKAAYRAFAGNVKPGGAVIACADDATTMATLAGIRGKVLTYGFSKDADLSAARIVLDGSRSSYACYSRGKLLGTVELSIPGRHNVLNSLAAVLLGLAIGIDFKRIVAAIRDFEGACRRFQVRAHAAGVMLVDDYAHHPTEIRSVISACRSWKYRRLIVVFQPHRYTRTRFLADAFGTCFAGADKLILTDIYAASEEPIAGVSSRTIYDKVVASGLRDVTIMDKDAVAAYIMKIKRRGDMVVVMGAGSIKNVADELAGALAAKRRHTNIRVREALKDAVRGTIIFDEALARRTSFKIGGPADIWAEPRDTGDLKRLYALAKRSKVPVFIIGKGTNVLARDYGFRGLVIHLGAPAFKKVRRRGTVITVGAGFSLPKLVRFACDNGLSGFESLVGIPGTVGGAVSMNAGGSSSPLYKNIGDFIVSLTVMDGRGRVRRLQRPEIAFGYRSSNLKRYIILEAVLRLARGDRQAIAAQCANFLTLKKEKQVLDLPSAGCVFKNPDRSQFTCGQMIDMLGLKGKRIGGAEISDRHANFIVNRCGAKAADVLALMEYVRMKVEKNYGIDLEPEVKII